jgi:hypothetical protein
VLIVSLGTSAGAPGTGFVSQMGGCGTDRIGAGFAVATFDAAGSLSDAIAFTAVLS